MCICIILHEKFRSLLSLSDSDQFIELKMKKVKQTIMHFTTKQYNTIQEMKYNAMQRKKMNQGYRPIRIFYLF